MEAVGSRFGRASSRYGPATTAFNGPVRKWRKMWVRVSSSSPTTNSRCSVHELLLRRWTAIPTISPAPASEFDGAAEEPPKRKCRYTPISVVEEHKNAIVKKMEDGEGNKIRVGMTAMAEEVQEKPDINLVFAEETTMVSTKKLISLNDPSESDLDLGLCLNGKTKNLGSVG